MQVWMIKIMKTDKNYTDLSRLNSFGERFNYLKLGGHVGETVFGRYRGLNQVFYKSQAWIEVRNFVIVRDFGLDLGCEGFEILDMTLVHHMNPITLEDLENENPVIIDPEYLITTSAGTHRAIHYGDETLIPRLSLERRPGDTRLW